MYKEPTPRYLQKPYRCEVFGCEKRYTDPSSLRKHVKNHTKEEEEQVKQTRDSSQGKITDTSQERLLESKRENPNPLPVNLTLMSGGGVMASGMHEFGSHYDSQYSRQVEDNQRMQQQQAEQQQYKRGKLTMCII